MAFGLIQQVLRGGEVVAIEVEVIRQNDHYIVRRGTNSGIEHEINLNDARGEIVGAYSVATLKGGYKTFEILDRNDIAEIGRAHVCTPVTNEPIVCRLLFTKKN